MLVGVVPRVALVLARMMFPVAAMGVLVARTARRLLLMAWRLDAAERAAKFVNFALIGKFLALGHLDQFQDFVQLVNRVLERFRNFRGVRHSLADG
jgi:hypothetical protein